MVSIRAAIIQDSDSISDLAAYLDSLAFEQYPTIFVEPKIPLRSREWLKQQLDSSNIRVFLATDREGRVVGFTRVHIGPTPDSLVMTAKSVGWLHELVMEPENALETGRMLIQAAHDWLLSSDVTQVRATMWPFQKDARTVLAELGYLPTNQNFLKDLEN